MREDSHVTASGTHHRRSGHYWDQCALETTRSGGCSAAQFRSAMSSPWSASTFTDSEFPNPDGDLTRSMTDQYHYFRLVKLLGLSLDRLQVISWSRSCNSLGRPSAERRRALTEHLSLQRWGPPDSRSWFNTIMPDCSRSNRSSLPFLPRCTGVARMRPLALARESNAES